MEILKFRPIYKERIWGGRKIETMPGRKLPPQTPIGESWELSGLRGDLSVVAQGGLKGNNIQELGEIYMGDLLGEGVYERYGDEFPLLVKIIDARENLSIQVHPNDAQARERHHSYGKTEAWHILDHDPGAKLYVGFNQKVDTQKYLEYLNAGRLEDLMQPYTVAKGETYFIPAGTVHAIGQGVLLAEIQQTSDITYRLFDYNRTDSQGKARELHTDLALSVIDFDSEQNFRIAPRDTTHQIVSCEYFVINSLKIEQGVTTKDYAETESFVIYTCTEGQVNIRDPRSNSRAVELSYGQTALVPAMVDTVEITGQGTILETSIPNQ